MTTKHLILGGARSGKSGFAEVTAEQLAKANSKQLIYVATATAGDQEMADRIKRHQQDRNSHWQLREHPLHLSTALDQATNQQCVLIDCLTMWLSNCLHQDSWQQEKELFLNAFEQCSADVVLVSNEVGSGIIPMGKLSRDFVDEIGWLHQTLAQQCDKATLVVAGLPQSLK